MNAIQIVRTKSKAHGGITDREKKLMDEHVKLWITRAMRTTPIEPEKISPAIDGLYEMAGLKKPRVVIVPSPLVMAFAYGASAAIWYARKHSKKSIATSNATYNATYNATRIATYNATDIATDSATDSATDELDGANACHDLAGAFGIACATRWANNYQGGNMWAGYDAYLTACRDILGLELTSHAAYTHWEQASIHGGFRVMHEEFCLVCDFPEVILKDDENRPHCEVGPSHRWRDGWSLYHLRGVRVPAAWIENKSSLDPRTLLSWPNLEQRRVGIELLGWDTVLSAVDARIIDADGDPQIGTLLEVKLPDLPAPSKFLSVMCGTGRRFVIGVHPSCSTAIEAQAWCQGLTLSEFKVPEIRA